MKNAQLQRLLQNTAAIICIFFIIIAPSPASSSEANPYFSEDTIPPTFLTPPLKPYSQEWNAEIDTILLMQKNANDNEIAQALDEREMRPELITLPVEPDVTRTNFPSTYNLLERVEKTAHNSSDYAKNYWNTKRPFLMDKRVKALIDPHDNPAYPSGHTVRSYCLAYTMALLKPEKQSQFLARANEVAHHRVLVGMHYPHDVQGGQALALLIMGGLLQNKEFLYDVQKAKNEIQKR